jgi:hypothetical protein
MIYFLIILLRLLLSPNLRLFYFLKYFIKNKILKRLFYFFKYFIKNKILKRDKKHTQNQTPQIGYNNEIITPSVILKNNNNINLPEDMETNAQNSLNWDPGLVTEDTILVDPLETQIDTDSTGNISSITDSSSENLSDKDLGVEVAEVSFTLEDVPDNVIREWKVEEINEVFSEQITQHEVTQTELREIMESIPIDQFFNDQVNDFILTIISQFH